MIAPLTTTAILIVAGVSAIVFYFKWKDADEVADSVIKSVERRERYVLKLESDVATLRNKIDLVIEENNLFRKKIRMMKAAINFGGEDSET